jgi:RES domain-containing protein
VAEHEEVANVLGSLKSSSWSGTVYRMMLGENPPDRENTQGARWNPPDLAAIYTSLKPETAIAEVEYNLARQPRPVRPDLRKTLYELSVALGAVVDLSSVLPDLERLGIGRDQLFSDDMKISQEIGRAIAWLGFDGLLVPSARADGMNLVIYPSRATPESYRFEIGPKTQR